MLILLFKKKFQNHYWGGTVEERFVYIFGIYKHFGGNNPSILTPSDSVDIATYAEWLVQVWFQHTVRGGINNGQKVYDA